MMNQDIVLDELQENLKTQRSFDGVKPEGWDAYMSSIADRVKEAFPDYLSNKRVLLPLIEAGAISGAEADRMPEAMRRNFDVGVAVVGRDPWRHDIDKFVEPHKNDPAFMAYAREHSPRVRSLYPDDAPGLDALIADATVRADTARQGQPGKITERSAQR